VTATAPAPARGTACPRCGAHLADDQAWCLNCGDAARTRLVPTPNWRLPLAVAAFVAALALLAIAISFIQLTRDDAPVTPTAATAPAATPAPTTTAPPAATATTPGATATTPGATATTPGDSATTPGATATTPGATATTPGATSTTPSGTTTP
jgi:uncharacterized iron-regulated membrane protein